MEERKIDTDIVPISSELFKAKVEIRFNNIIEGLDRFQNKTIYGDNFEENFNLFMKEALKINNNRLIVDFYSNSLTDESIEVLKSKLDKNDIKILEKILDENHGKYDFYKIKNEEILNFFIKLSTRELFFITYYFYDIPITIWGNYNCKFPIFYKENQIDLYKPLIYKNNLKLI